MDASSQGLSLAVVGCGHWGPNHIRSFSALQGIRVAWAVDKSPQRRAHVSSLYERTSVTGDLDDVLGDPAVDAVVVATPTGSHYEIAIAAIQAGKHVLCEKPLGMTSAECEALVATAKSSGVVLMVGHVFLFNGGILKLKELMRFGDLGGIHYASAVRTNLGPIREDINAAYDLASHDVSIFNFLFDSSPISVSACGHAYLKPGIEDVVFITLTYPNDIIVAVEASWLNPKKVRQITLVGDKKMATWDDLSSMPVSIYDKGVAREPYYDSYGEFHLLTREGDVAIPRIQLDEPLKRQAKFFIDAIGHGSASVCSGEHGLAVVRVLEAIGESMRQGGAQVALGHVAESVAP